MKLSAQPQAHAVRTPTFWWVLQDQRFVKNTLNANVQHVPTITISIVIIVIRKAVDRKAVVAGC